MAATAFPSDYLDDNILDHILRNNTFTSPTTVYLALFEGDPTGAGTEISGGSYARQTMSFGASSAGSISTNATITFTALPDSAGITHYGIYDDVSAGNLLIHGTLAETLITNSGDDIEYASGDFSISITGS